MSTSPASPLRSATRNEVYNYSVSKLIAIADPRETVYRCRPSESNVSDEREIEIKGEQDDFVFSSLAYRVHGMLLLFLA